jgi:adenine-specific DNA-methyltransferase
MTKLLQKEYRSVAVLQKNTLFSEYEIDLKHPFFKEHLITYIGNKRSLLPFLNKTFIEIKNRLKKEKITALDGFSGSGCVSRLLLLHSSYLVSNDLEKYAYIINKSYLQSRENLPEQNIKKWIDYIESKIDEKSNSTLFFTKNYAPKDDTKIQDGERVFYTTRNARYIDIARNIIHNEVPENIQNFLMANLLIKASVHTNTSGVFKGFHKKEGIGHFGGKGENALVRIKKDIQIETPICIEHACAVTVEQQDTNVLVQKYADTIFDIVYYDPPYNQHPYGSNYFMLNLIAEKEDGIIQSGVSGISKEWNKSDYNKRNEAEKAMDHLILNTNARYIVISYNNEGIIPIANFRTLLEKYGTVELKTQEYQTYRGSRNLKERSNTVDEMLWIVEKK